MSKDIYTEAYLKNTLAVLKDISRDLSMWSVYNGDKINDELVILDDARFLIEKKLEVEA